MLVTPTNPNPLAPSELRAFGIAGGHWYTLSSHSLIRKLWCYCIYLLAVARRSSVIRLRRICYQRLVVLFLFPASRQVRLRCVHVCCYYCSGFARSQSAADGIGNGHVVYPGRRRHRDRERTSAARHYAHRSPSSPAPAAVTNQPGQSCLWIFCLTHNRLSYRNIVLLLYE